jgi:arylsulfatase A-like enzyme
MVSNSSCSACSFPNYQHASGHNEIGAFEENFRVPFILRAPHLITPTIYSKRMRPGGSHVDIGPTLFALLGIQTEHHFYGESLLVDAATVSQFGGHQGRPTLLSQPYDGVHLCTVQWPYKLCAHRGEWGPLRHLVRDPHEERDAVSDSPEAVEVLQKLKRDLRFMPGITQNMLEQNRLFGLRSLA